MKKINLTILGLAFLLFSACDKETTADKSRVTNYPLITVVGDNVVFVPQGGTYADPGVSATENGAEIEVATTVSGAYRGGSSLDLSKADCYDVTYTATNADGFDGSSERRVYVVETGDMVNSIEGLYTSTIVRNGDPKFSDLEYVLVWKNDDGTYEFSCGFGGYYEIGTGYGLGYKSGGCVVTATSIPLNTYSITDFSNDGFGGAITDAKLTADPVTKTLKLTCEWSFGYSFDVELTQVAL